MVARTIDSLLASADEYFPNIDENLDLAFAIFVAYHQLGIPFENVGSHPKQSQTDYNLHGKLTLSHIREDKPKPANQCVN